MQSIIIQFKKLSWFYLSNKINKDTLFILEFPPGPRFEIYYKKIRQYIVPSLTPDMNKITFNDDNAVDGPWKVEFPATFKDDKAVVADWKVRLPTTFNDDIAVVAPCNMVLPLTFNEEPAVTWLLK